MGKLDNIFGQPPLSVLNTATGKWKQQRQRWLDLGIKGEEGRTDRLTANGQETPNAVSGDWQAANGGATHQEWHATSVFDPYLTELVYRWFSPPGGRILDPFAGGAVRGVVASRLGRGYTGIELRAEQVQANEAHRHLCLDPAPLWLTGDSHEVVPTVDEGHDLLFTCPPYGDLERYSDDEADLSTMSWPGFVRRYSAILKRAAGRLRRHAFAAFVVSPFRDKDTGFYRDLPRVTAQAMEEAGLAFYNDAILLAPVASNGALVRCARSFLATRKLTRIHQNVLVFVKGDPKMARAQIDAAGGRMLPEPEPEGETMMLPFAS